MPPSQTDSDDGTVTIDNFTGTGDAGDDDGGGDGNSNDDESLRVIAAGLDDPDTLAAALVAAAPSVPADRDAFSDEFREVGIPSVRGPGDVGSNGRVVVYGSDPAEVRAYLLDLVRGSDERNKVVLTDWLVYCDGVASLSSWLDAVLQAGATVTALGSDVVLAPDGIEGAGVPALLGELSTAALDPRDHPSEGIEVLRHDWAGRTPIATEVSERGNLIPSRDYERVRTHLLDVVEGGESRMWASNRIGCSLRTVSRILDDPDKRELYRLPAAGE